MSFFQHPAVKEILAKRDAYEEAKDTFLFHLLSDPGIYTVPRYTLTYWLDTCVNDRALQEEIRAHIAAGPPIIHWGDEGMTACEAPTGVRQWQVVERFSEAVTCPACQDVQARATLTNGAYPARRS